MQKIFIPIAIVALVALYFAVTVFYDRWQNASSPSIKPDTSTEKSLPRLFPSNETRTPLEDDTPRESDDDDDDENNSSTDASESTSDARNSVITIERTDCTNDCSTVDAANRTYCREVCGLSQTPHTGVCTEKIGLEKDYCWRDEAIKQSDTALCENIADKNIHTTCAARILEDLFEASSLQ